MVNPDQDPIRRAITQEFFRIVAEKPDEYELFTSPVATEELDRAKTEEKRRATIAFLETIRYTELPENIDAGREEWDDGDDED